MCALEGGVCVCALEGGVCACVRRGCVLGCVGVGVLGRGCLCLFESVGVCVLNSRCSFRQNHGSQ